MGGTALSHLNVRRFSASEYAQRISQFDTIVTEILDKHKDLQLIYEIPMPIFGKEDYGDMDVVYFTDKVELVRSELISAFNSKGYKANGQVNSIEWNQLQVDMIYSPLESFHWSHNWYAHGDSSALMGRVAKYYGFKFDNRGLYFTVKTKSFAKDVVVTRSWSLGNNILGYKPLFFKHMYKEEEIFEHTVTSPFVHKDIFTTIKRQRSKTRTLQSDFQDWVMNLPDDTFPNTYPQEHGWTLLREFSLPIYLKCLLISWKMQLRELYNPLKTRYRKFKYVTLEPFLWNHVYPVILKAQGWL
jgi:hypothetical protein